MKVYNMTIQARDVLLNSALADTEEGGTWEGKRSWGWEMVNKKRRNGESTFPKLMACDRVSYSFLHV